MKAALQVEIPGRSYTVGWTEEKKDLLDALRPYREKFHSHFLLVDPKVLKLHGPLIRALVPGAPIIPVRHGEKNKTIAEVERLLELLIRGGADRGSCLWAIGGGVTGDITGFAAAVYMRGMEFIQIPTTLLAMVDSSVGGKTGINLKGGKNMAGSFHQPAAVFMHLPFLKTLSNREYRCGLAEIVKSALIQDRDFFERLEANAEAIAAMDPAQFLFLSQRSVAIKAGVVSRDERESGVRAILNFGHTLGHAIEAWGDYRLLLHGEAVAIGMSFAGFLAWRSGIWHKEDFDRLYDLLDKLGLPRDFGGIPGGKLPTDKRLLQFMKSDKKSRKSEVYFVLPERIGKCRLPEKVKDADLLSALGEFRKL